MSKATGKNKQPIGPKPEPEVAKAKKEAEGKVIAVVNSKALSVDVGPRVIAGMSKSIEQEEQANKIILEVAAKRFDMLADTTAAIVKAAKADNNINLSAVFKDDKKAMSLLNDQLGLALGFRQVSETKDAGGNIIKKIGYATAVQAYFPMPKEDKNDPKVIRKATVRSNFLHLLKKSAQAAVGIIDNDLTMKKDKATGTLQLTGPALEKQFGSDTILLNDKQTIGEGDKATKLKEKPSFTAMGRMGAAAAGKVLAVRKDSRTRTGAVDPDTAIQSLCVSLTEAIAKMKEKPIAKTIASLNSVKTSIEGLIARATPAST